MHSRGLENYTKSNWKPKKILENARTIKTLKSAENHKQPQTTHEKYCYYKYRRYAIVHQNPRKPQTTPDNPRKHYKAIENSRKYQKIIQTSRKPRKHQKPIEKLQKTQDRKSQETTVNHKNTYSPGKHLQNLGNHRQS